MIRNLIDYMSRDVCQVLITSGIIAATLTVTDATNAAPIVVATQTPHLLFRNAIVFIQGVTGNTAANDFWIVTPVDSTHLQLQGSTGNGAYAGGGTLQTALVGGKILMGRYWVLQNQNRPRIVMVPVDGEDMPRDQYAIDAGTIPGEDQTSNQRAALIAPAVSVMRTNFEVHCWGQAVPADRDFDFDATEILRDQVLRTLDKLFRGNYTTSKGQWVDQQEKASTEMVAGHLFKFFATIDAPVTAEPQFFAPPSTGFVADIEMNNTGTPELAVELTK